MAYYCFHLKTDKNPVSRKLCFVQNSRKWTSSGVRLEAKKTEKILFTAVWYCDRGDGGRGRLNDTSNNEASQSLEYYTNTLV